MTCTCACTSTPTRRRRVSPSLIVACLALIVATAGTSYAAGLGRNSVGTAQLRAGAVTGAKIAPGAVTYTRIKPGAVTSSRLGAGSVVESRIANGAVTLGKLGPDAVTGGTVVDSSLGSADIADGSLNAGDIAANSLNGTRIADNSLGLIDVEQSALDALIDVPTELVTYNFDGGATSVSLRDPEYDPVLSWSTHVDAVGGSVVLAQVGVGSIAGTEVTCRITIDGVTATSSTTTVAAGREIVSLMTVADLTIDDVVQVQCTRSSGDAAVDTSPTTSATAMTIIRIAR